jgi:choline dehydrogenase-like flavoprotein
MVDLIIVGSGAAGAAAALQLARRGIRPTMLDVGITPSEPSPRAKGNLYEWRQGHDSFDLQIGADLRGVSDVLTGQVGVAKLNAPNATFVTAKAQRFSPVDAVNFDPIQSFAFGGLGNAWGAGLYRFVDADLAGFPIRPADLDPYADVLTREIGISGADDDLSPYFGSPAGLQPPLALSHNAAAVLARYGRNRLGLNRGGVFLGRPRIAALSAPLDGREAVDYSNTEFWQDQPYLYTPALTLKKLIAAGQLDYRPEILVHSWTETPTGVIVRGREGATNAPVELTGSALLLAAGAIGTSKIVLGSAGDVETRLPLLENPALQIPFVLPGSLGRALDAHCFGLTQLNLIWQAIAYGCTVQASLLEVTSPMRAEFYGRFPLSARANLALVKQMLPAMLVMQLFFPAAVQPPAQLGLQPNGHLRIDGHPNAIDLRKLGGLLAAMRSLGLWTHPILIQRPVTGHAIHYAGTLPMRESPGRYECDSAGKLSGTKCIYIVDSACFSSLPAKNMSLGMMANAMRIAECAVRNLACHDHIV